MRFFEILLFLFFFSSCLSQKKKINIQLTYTEEYCGGARLSPELQAEYNKAKAYANKTIIILSDKGRADSSKTDGSGLLKLKLKRGTYRVYEPWRYNLFTPEDLPIESFDRACLKTEWEKQVFTIVVERTKQRVVSQNPIIKYCPWAVPCLNSEDAPPPSRQQ